MQRAIIRLNRSKLNQKMVKKALVCLADKAEDTEVVITVDTLRRAGIEAILAGVQGSEPVTCVENIRIVPDLDIDQCQNDLFDVVVLPGGPGYQNLQNSSTVASIVQKHWEHNKKIAAICAGTKVLKNFKIGLGSNITTFSKYKQDLADSYKVSDDRVVVDGNLITSQCPGTAFEFGLSIVKELCGQEKSNEIAQMLKINC